MDIHKLNAENIYLFDDTEDLKFPIRCLSDFEVQTLLYANEVLYEFQYYNRKMFEINVNLEEYHNTISKYSTVINEINGGEVNEGLMNDIFVNVNRTFTNFVTSLKTFVEHLLIRFLKKYGENSEQISSFKSLVRFVYDTYFSYRLLVNIRDYAIHHSYPIDKFFIDTIPNVDQNTFYHELSVQFNKTKLLVNEKLRRKLGNDLRKFNDHFPVKYVMLEIQEPIKKIFDKFLAIEYNYFIAQANTVATFVNENNQSTKTSFGKVTRSSGSKYKFETTIIPFYIVEQFRSKSTSTKVSF